jgi:hypothetical protein
LSDFHWEMSGLGGEASFWTPFLVTAANN